MDARGKQGSRQGQTINSAKNFKEYATDQYGHRLYSVQGRGASSSIGLKNQTVYIDGIERFKGTEKACTKYCNSHHSRGYVIVSLVRG